MRSEVIFKKGNSQSYEANTMAKQPCFLMILILCWNSQDHKGHLNLTSFY